MLTRKNLTFTIGLVLALIVITVVFRSLRNGQQTRHPDKFLIPLGYVGWFVIEHGVQGAPPASLEGDYLVHRFPSSGRLKTSSPVELGAEKGNTDDKAYYVDGTRLIRIPNSWPAPHTASDVRIWGRGVYGAIPEQGIPLIEVAFVGTESQYAQASTGPVPKSEKQQARDDALAAQDRAEQKASKPK